MAFRVLLVSSATVSLREAGYSFFFVLGDALGEGVGYAEVENAGFTGHETDVEGALRGVDSATGWCADANEDEKKEREIPLSPGRPFAPMKAFGVNRSEGEEKVGLLRSVPQNHPGCERRK